MAHTMLRSFRLLSKSTGSTRAHGRSFLVSECIIIDLDIFQHLLALIEPCLSIEHVFKCSGELFCFCQIFAVFCTT